MAHHFLKTVLTTIIVSVSLASSVLAQNNQRPEHNKRQPPQEAVEACFGLTANQNCEFSSKRGNESGTCFAPQKNLPLACAPSQNSAQPNPQKVRTQSAEINSVKNLNNSAQSHSMIEKLSGLISTNFLGNYIINDKRHGTIVEVQTSENTRNITSNALPNHSTGQFPNQGNPNAITTQERSWSLPLNPEYAGHAVWVREAGVAINGVKFEPETNERVNCSSGEIYRIEAVQDMLDLGLDFNNAHVQPTGEYHYHGISQELVEFSDDGHDLVHIGFAADGFLILYSKSGAYKPSYQLKTSARTGTDCIYQTRRQETRIQIDNTAPDGTYVSDWEYIEGLGNLDQCDGTFINDQYVYIASDEYPYVGRCLNGQVSQEERRPPQGSNGINQAQQRPKRP